MTDMLGSVYALSDSTGTLQATWSYDVYGTRTQNSGTISYPFGFAGREHDGDTGLVYSRQRYYDPSVGGWLNPDRLYRPDLRGKFSATGANLYEYVEDRPTLMIDLMGLAGSLADVAIEVQEVDQFYQWWLGQEQNQIGTSAYQTLLYWQGQASIVCGDLGFILQDAINQLGFPDIHAVAEFAPSPFFFWPDTGVEILGTVTQGGVTTTNRFNLYFPYLALFFPSLGQLEEVLNGF